MQNTVPNLFKMQEMEMRRLETLNLRINVGESVSATEIFPKGGGMYFACVCGGVGGGAPGTRVGVYAQLRVRPPVARAIKRGRSGGRLIADVTPGHPRPKDHVVHRRRPVARPPTDLPRPASPRLDRSPTDPTHRPTRSRVATPRRGGKDTPPDDALDRGRDDWERGGTGRPKIIVEKMWLTESRKPSKV